MKASELLLVAILPCAIVSWPQSRRAVTVADCTKARYFLDDTFYSPIVMNPQGTRAAYLVNAPDVESNQDIVQLYVISTQETDAPQPKLMVSGPGISHLQWMPGGLHILVRMRRSDRLEVVEVNTITGETRSLAELDGSDVNEYTTDRNANVIVFASDVPVPKADVAVSEQDSERGYRIPSKLPIVPSSNRAKLYITRRGRDGQWTRPQPITIVSPLTHQPLPSLPYYLGLMMSLSPDGKSLLLTTKVDPADLPELWKGSPFIRGTAGAGGGLSLTILYDMESGATSIPIKTPLQFNLPIWSEDGIAFVIDGQSPVDSEWERQDAIGKIGFYSTPHLFYVEPQSGKIEEIASQVANINEQPLKWSGDGELFLHAASDEIAVYKRFDAKWSKVSFERIPVPDFYRFAHIATDGKLVLSSYESPSTPPKLLRYTRASRRVETLAKLNPEFDSLTLAPIRSVSWKTSSHYEVHGLLFLPTGYQEGVRYPLVIDTKPTRGEFLCDSGWKHYPSFAPQPLANAGIMMLTRSDWNGTDEPYYPAGYPGGNRGVREAAFHADMWDSAVESLDRKGLIDPNKVGLMGFSRAGWYTEFALAHGRTHYAAATVADNIRYSLGEYWLWQMGSRQPAFDETYGGPPWGQTLSNWLKYSVSFNLDKFHTPLLMEEMGMGIPYKDYNAPPALLSTSFEIFTGLNERGKPVEMYYYPNEQHQPEHPAARLASLQRNVDWYRFWLQGYERPSPEDPEQYTRWRALRILQEGGPTDHTTNTGKE